MFSLSCLVGASILFSGNALKDIPERARHGKAYEMISSNHTLKASEAQFWESKCDPLDAANDCTFPHKYFVDETFWNGKGPVFLDIGGEGTLTAPSGYIMTLAEKYNGLVVALEHRFYGESIPNGNADTENLAQYLKVDLALADLNDFTEFIKKEKDCGDAAWVGVGGSYPGALASWYRTSYPDATIGTLSSSGVVNCIVDYTGFDKQVTAAIGSECADQIRSIQSAYERTIGTTKGRFADGWNKALESFNCESDMSARDFYYMIADSWSMADQYSAKSQLCGTMMAVGEDASDEVLMDTFSSFSKSFWGEDFCTGGFYNTKQMANPDRWDVNSRSWRFQTCAEVSYFNTAPSSGSLRSTSVNLEYHLEQCQEVFGVKMFPASLAMNQKFGGPEPAADHVFYSDFSDDPWARASVDYSVSSTQPYFLSQCDDCGHCKDLHAPSDSDPEPIKQSRAEFEKYLDKWMAEYAAKK